MPRLSYWLNPKNIFYEIKWFIQRGRRGYSDQDLWSLDYYLASWLPDALEWYADKGHSYPGRGRYKTYKAWSRDLKIAAKRIRRFNEVVDHTDMDLELWDKDESYRGEYISKSNEAREEVLKGMKFISRNFFDLWD